MSNNQPVICQICHQNTSKEHCTPVLLARGGLLNLIREDQPLWDKNGCICQSCLNRYRSKYVQSLMEKDLGELDELEQEVVTSLRDNELLSENLNEEHEQQLTLGDRLADKVAEFGGSWSFIIWFAIFIAVWIIINTTIMLAGAFDPYPFILLNLFLSMLAAIQAPIIMMCQSRQANRDRIRAENDYQVNLKSEMEIRIISEKLDQLLHQDMHSFMEIQQIQMDMLNELHNKLN